ncbi:hypothetical protein E2C01_089883 [Portunus trituberculatus]|uniref:Uncharacterized protein n=1 Tax=Portunus trituberculatus TaxID=210409 RepID=A0A5B7JJZ4_PORTR|nr:hypothetical protein [Portunus trituberculatus]
MSFFSLYVLNTSSSLQSTVSSYHTNFHTYLSEGGGLPPSDEQVTSNVVPAMTSLRRSPKKRGGPGGSENLKGKEKVVRSSFLG